MGFKDRAQALVEQRAQNRRCIVVSIADDFDEVDRQEYFAVLADRKFSSSDIQGLLADEGKLISSSAIANHRAERRRCGCGQ